MIYKLQLKDPRWLEKRAEIIALAENQCEICGESDEGFEVHHGCYLPGRMAWEYDNDLLYCLCPTCHYNIHEQWEAALIEMGRRNKHLHIVVNAIKKSVHAKGDESVDLETMLNRIGL